MEMMDVYDEDRRPTGRTLDRDKGTRPGEYLTMVHLCLFNTQGELLIQQRQTCKRAFPDLWDLSVGGGVRAGENSRTAIAREAWEELGLCLDLSGVRPAMTVNFDDGFDDIYLMEGKLELSTLRLQADEVRDVRWASLSDVEALSADGTFIPYYSGFLRLLFEMRGRMGFLKRI